VAVSQACLSSPLSRCGGQEETDISDVGVSQVQDHAAGAGGDAAGGSNEAESQASDEEEVGTGGSCPA
jgi:hypothetical protein